MGKIGTYIKNKIPFAYLKDLLNKIVFPGSGKLSLYYVLSFFFKGIKEGAITIRASSISFNLFLAIFPAIIFIFTLIPYIPIDNFQMQLLAMLKDIMPYNAYRATESTLIDIISYQRGGLLSIGFVSAMFFSTNAINSMISAFNATFHSIETRSWVKQRLVAIVLTLIMALLILTAVTLIIVEGVVVNYLLKFGLIKIGFTYYLLETGKWVIIIALYYFAISFIYYLGPSRKSLWKFISPGGTFATVLSIIASIGFSYFINNFGQYNKIYGSIGTLIGLLLWLNFNSIAILLGFELSASIKGANKNKIHES